MSVAAVSPPKLEKKPVKFSNLLLGAGLNMFEVTTLGSSMEVDAIAFLVSNEVLGQPLEVIKTTMAANRGDSFAKSLVRIWGRGGLLGCKLPDPRREDVWLILRHVVQFTRVSSLGLGSRLLRRALSSYSSPLRLNTKPVHSERENSLLVSLVELLVVLRKHMPPWASARV